VGKQPPLAIRNPPSASPDTRPRLKTVHAVFYSISEGEYGSTYYDAHEVQNLRHELTIIAYWMNGQPLGVVHGAPLRLRVENELGFKMVKWQIASMPRGPRHLLCNASPFKSGRRRSETDLPGFADRRCRSAMHAGTMIGRQTAYAAPTTSAERVYGTGSSISMESFLMYTDSRTMRV
jgi:hypothetical protein